VFGIDLYRLNSQRFPTLRLYLQFGLYRILVYSGVGLDRFIQDSGLFRGWLRQVYTGFWFIQGSGLFRGWFRLSFTVFEKLDSQ